MTKGVLITDGHWRKSLAAVRALGQQHIPVTVGETCRPATAALSRYCTHSLRYPSPEHAAGQFLEWLDDYLKNNPQRMLLPMEDATVLLAAENRDKLSAHTFIPVVPADMFKKVRQKDYVLRLAQKLGVPTPRTWFVDDMATLPSLASRLPYPVVIKPRIGSGAVGVSYASDAKSLIQQYRRTHARFAFPMIQEKIPAQGPGLGASFLFDAGGICRATFMHRRIREYPVSGGASTLRVSIWRDDLRDMGVTLLRALDWFGVAMVEFKLDPRDGVPKLMEINPRFWGSLALAVHAGVNFPHLLYRMASGEHPRPVESYRLGVHCRWLLHGDLLHFVKNRQRHRLKPGFFNNGFSGMRYDILSLKDPMPAIGRLLMPLTLLYDGDMKKRLKLRNKQ